MMLLDAHDKMNQGTPCSQKLTLNTHSRNVKYKSIKFLEENIRGNVFDCNYANNFLHVRGGQYV
jgi:hypothetical protein